MQKHLNSLHVPKYWKDKSSNYESHEIYIYYKPHEFFINDKIQSSYVGCISLNLKQPIHVEHHVQSNNMKYVKRNEHAYNSIYIDIYNKQMQDVTIIPFIFWWKIIFLKQL
jgi:hypothetical protein